MKLKIVVETPSQLVEQQLQGSAVQVQTPLCPTEETMVAVYPASVRNASDCLHTLLPVVVYTGKKHA